MRVVSFRILRGDAPLKLSGCVPDEHGLRLYYWAGDVVGPTKITGLQGMLEKARRAVWAPIENIAGRCRFRRRAVGNRGQAPGNLECSSFH